MFQSFLASSVCTERNICIIFDLWKKYHKSANTTNESASSCKQKQTDRVQVLHDVLEGWVHPELLKELPLVEQCVHQVGVVVQRVAQAGVDDFQHHADHLLNHI